MIKTSGHYLRCDYRHDNIVYCGYGQFLKIKHKVVRMELPKYDELMSPVLKALEELGGSGSNGEIEAKIVELLDLPEELTSLRRDPPRGNRSKLSERLSWAKSYLKAYGLIDNSDRGIWSLSPKYRPGQKIDRKKIIRFVNRPQKTQAAQKQVEKDIPPDIANENENAWKDAVLQELLQLSPKAFEHLSVRILRESGFVHLEVTGRSGDGGIDGKGILRLQNIVSYHVVFQCKRYRGSISSSAIRDFRGAMMGRADKGLFITTGTFTNEAKKEAIRDGASPIDLIEGDDLVQMLKTLRLGVQVHVVEKVEVDTEWFKKYAKSIA
jgi:restriction system protein